MKPELLSRLAASVQPLVFETEIREFPYATKGTAFLVGYRGRAFVLTARHALNPDRLSPVCIFPSDTSQRILPLDDVFFVSETVVPDDYVDLAVIEIDVAGIQHAELEQAHLIDMALASGDWLPHAHSSEFVILGFPEEHSFVDYASKEIGTIRMAMIGRYCGPSSIEYLHELEIVDGPPLQRMTASVAAPYSRFPLNRITAFKSYFAAWYCEELPPLDEFIFWTGRYCSVPWKLSMPRKNRKYSAQTPNPAVERACAKSRPGRSLLRYLLVA